MDEKESDGNTYIYVTFSDTTTTATYDLHMLRIRTTGTLAIDWHMKYQRTGTTEENIPYHIFRDMTDSTTLYWAGKFSDYGSIYKFQRRDGKILWKVDFTDGTTNSLDEVTSFA
jgi:hypothetical protein